MKNNKKWCQILTIMLPCLGVIVILLRNQIISLSEYFPPCFTYTYLHISCPACGNTRCVRSMLRGDFITALRYNMTPPLLMVLGLLLYVEMATYSFGTHKKILPRKEVPYFILMGLFFIYYILRNIIPDVIFCLV